MSRRRASGNSLGFSSYSGTEVSTAWPAEGSHSQAHTAVSWSLQPHWSSSSTDCLLCSQSSFRWLIKGYCRSISMSEVVDKENITRLFRKFPFVHLMSLGMLKMLALIVEITSFLVQWDVSYTFLACFILACTQWNWPWQLAEIGEDRTQVSWFYFLGAFIKVGM
jgi:hypothetical protein